MSTPTSAPLNPAPAPMDLSAPGLKDLILPLLNPLPLEILVLDSGWNVVFANDLYKLSRPSFNDSFIGLHVMFVVSGGLYKPVEASIHRVQKNHAPDSVMDIRYESRWQKEKTVNLFTIPAKIENREYFILVFNNITEFESIRFQLEIIQEIGFFMVGTLDLNRLLFLVLTGMTAGPALGFNRAFVFLINETETRLEGMLGVGPVSEHEAGMIWSRVSNEKRALRDFLNEYEVVPDKSNMPLTMLATRLSCGLEKTDNILVKTALEKKSFHIRRHRRDPDTPDFDQKIYETCDSDEFITVPLMAAGKVLGVLLADNRFNHHPITEQHKKLLEVFANLVGVTIANAFRHQQLVDAIEKYRVAAQQLDQANKDLAHAEQFATIGRTVAMVSHEIRNPLATIGGFARSNLKNLQNPEKIKRNSEIILSEVQRLEIFLRDTLDYLRKPDPKIVMDNICQLLDDICALMAREAHDQNVTITSRHTANIPSIPIDTQMIKHAIINLIKNAISFSPEGAGIEVEARLEEEMVHITVTDHGAGISKENLEKIFTPFFTTKDTGTGLGLSITRRIVEGHRGSIKFASELNRGTTVHVYLPVS